MYQTPHPQILCCSIISRSDLFHPMLNQKANIYSALSVVEGGQAATDAIKAQLKEDKANVKLAEADNW
jgi:hypothetical protein